MGYLTTRNVKISGVSACVPRRVEENSELPFFADRVEAEKVIASTGIARRRVSEQGVTASDLAETIKLQQFDINQLKKENNMLRAKLSRAAQQGFRI